MKSFWTYQAATRTPTYEEAVAAGKIKDGNRAAWEALSPGMRREIMR